MTTGSAQLSTRNSLATWRGQMRNKLWYASHKPVTWRPSSELRERRHQQVANTAQTRMALSWNLGPPAWVKRWWMRPALGTCRIWLAIIQLSSIICRNRCPKNRQVKKDHTIRWWRVSVRLISKGRDLVTYQLRVGPRSPANSVGYLLWRPSSSPCRPRTTSASTSDNRWSRIWCGERPPTFSPRWSEARLAQSWIWSRAASLIIREVIPWWAPTLRVSHTSAKLSRRSRHRIILVGPWLSVSTQWRALDCLTKKTQTKRWETSTRSNC